jgi:hypothetical protein
MWDVEWKAISRRLDRWCATAEVHLRHIDEMRKVSDTWQQTAIKAIGYEAKEIFNSINALRLPADLQEKLDAARERLAPLMRIMDEDKVRHVVSYRWVVLATLRAPLDEALAATEEPRRRLVERAFLHLNRTLTVDPDARDRWGEAFAQGEPRCEQLGALHLLSHGIYAFKADAGSGRTDLILGTPVSLADDVRSAEALVLTEWKLFRDGDDAAAKALEGKSQAERYAQVELAGIELRGHRYVVLVSMQPIPFQFPRDETDRGVRTHYVNVVIDPPSPSVQARQIASSAGEA